MDRANERLRRAEIRRPADRPRSAHGRGRSAGRWRWSSVASRADGAKVSVRFPRALASVDRRGPGVILFVRGGFTRAPRPGRLRDAYLRSREIAGGCDAETVRARPGAAAAAWPAGSTRCAGGRSARWPPGSAPRSSRPRDRRRNPSRPTSAMGWPAHRCRAWRRDCVECPVERCVPSPTPTSGSASSSAGETLMPSIRFAGPERFMNRLGPDAILSA